MTLFFRGLAACAALFLSAAACASNTDATRFNPAMTVVIQGGAYYDNLDNEGMGYLERSSAFAAQGEVEAERRAFNIDGTELAFSSNVDSYFTLWVAATIEDEALELEEAWLQTQAMPYGLQLKAGRLLSQIGYQNSKHTHDWDFIDQNLAYTALFHGEHLGGDGVQLTWLAPTNAYLLLGSEVLQGDELNGFGQSLELDDMADELGVDEDKLGLTDRRGPNLVTGFVHFSPNWSGQHALQLGLSAAWHQQQRNRFEVAAGDLLSQGNAYLYGLQAVYKRFARDSYGTHGLTLTAEMFAANSRQRGSVFDSGSVVETNQTSQLRENAGYLQAVYGIAPRWQVGLRHAVSGVDSRYRAAAEHTSLSSSRQTSALLAWNPSEFSRLRLQVSRSHLWPDGDHAKTLNQVMLSYTLIIGAHPAHQF